jgi:protocatechuate 3,4-dioxygenase beta subunit
VTGRVLDSEGRPLAGVEILGPSDGEQTHRRLAVSGPDGSFTVPAQADRTHSYIAVCLPGWLEESLSYAEGVPRGPIELRLRRPARLYGRVVDRQGRPVAGSLSISFAGEPRSIHCEESPLLRSGDTDAEGRFSFEGLEPGPFSASGILPNRFPLQAELAESSREVEIVLPGDWTTLEGLVFDAEGAPLEGASVHVTGAVYSEPVLTDAAGAYRLGRVPVGQQRFSVRHPTAGSVEGDVDTRRNLRHDFRLPRLTPLEGRILGSDGSLIPQLRLTVDSRPVEVEADGRFHTAVSPGWHQLEVERTGWWGPVRQAITAGAELLTVDLRLPRIATIRGRITGLAPEERGHVHLKKGSGGPERGTADEKGWFQLSALTPGEHTLVETAGSRRQERTIQVDEGAQITVDDFRFPLLPRIRGRVLDPAGRPLSILVLLRQPGSREDQWTEDDGTFEAFLVAGTWTILVDQEGFGPASMILQVKDEPIDLPDLRLVEEVTVSGSIVGLAPGEEISEIFALSEDGTWQRVAQVDEEKRFRIPRLRPGNWTLKARSKEREVSAPLRILPGTKEVHADLDFTNAVAGSHSRPR